MTDMTSTSLSINYDGPDVDSGEMDVNDLAPALLAVGKLFEEANRVVNGEKSVLKVRVKANFQNGSFEVDLNLLHGWVAHVRDLLAGQDATALANLCGVLGVSALPVGVGLFQLLKMLRGRKPKSARILEDGNVELIIYDGPDSQNAIIVSNQTLALYRDVRVRKAAAAAVKPLERDGISNISIRPTGLPKADADVSIAKSDLASFRAPDAEDTLIIGQTVTVAYSIVNLSFNDDGKWKLSDGVNTIWASIVDQKFLDRLNRNEEAFTKGDILLCRAHVQQWQTPTGLRTDTQIQEVLEHRHPEPGQITLDFSAPEPRS